MPAKRLPGTAATTRLRKLECEDACGASVRASRAVMLRGRFQCCCGAQLIPAALEDAHLLHDAGILTVAQLRSHPEHIEYTHALASAYHGQAGPARRAVDGGASFTDPAELAFRRVLASRAQAAQSSRRNALTTHRPNQPAATVAASDPIPF